MHAFSGSMYSVHMRALPYLPSWTVFQSADLFRLVVRAGSVTDDGEYRDVAVSWRAGFVHFLASYKGVKNIFLPH